MNLENLKKCFYEASQGSYKYIGVLVEMFGFAEKEIIINPNENFDKKYAYYETAYNENLTLKNAPDKIKIVGFTFGNTFEEIEKDLIQH